MLDYTGVKCPVCGVPFRKDNDIVVCPECGAPYHRECYQNKGACIFGELHEKGEEWAPPPPPAPPSSSAEIKDRECPACGVLNSHSALFCSHCGASLLGSPQQHSNTGRPENPVGTPPPGGPYVPPYNGGVRSPYQTPFVYDPLGGVNPADLLDDDVTYGDASKLVKQNTRYYMPIFRYMKMSGRNKFNFCAFFFTGGWMLYRKQYKFGSIFTALLLCIYLAYIFISLFVSAPVLTSYLEQAGLDLSQGLDPSSPQWMALTELLMAHPADYLKIALPTLCLGVVLIFRIILGIRGNRMYMEHCIRTARQVKTEGHEGDPNMTLDGRGGVNTAIAVCLGICYFFILLPIMI